MPYDPSLRRALAAGERLTVYRAVDLSLVGDVDIDSLRSSAELDRPARPIEVEFAELRDGISCFSSAAVVEATIAAARAAAEKRQQPMRMGSLVAELLLEGDDRGSVEVAVWGARGHLTVWADPYLILTCARIM